MMRMRNLVCILIFAAVPSLAFAQGPTGIYYLTAGDNGNNWRVQGTNAVSSTQANSIGNGGEYAIAVSNDIRTLGNGNSGGDSGQRLGSLYGLNFNYLNVDYPYPTPGTRYFYDGTTDGSFIYAVDYGSGEVMRFNMDWTSPTLMFDTGFGGFNSLGITYDSSNNSLWVSQWGGNEVRNYSMGGSLLSSFNATNFANSLTALAYDPLSDTLWMGSQIAQGNFSEYTKTGNLLQTQIYGALVPENTLGGEFQIAPVPEPTTLALTGIAMSGAWFAHRVHRRRKTTRRKK